MSIEDCHFVRTSYHCIDVYSRLWSESEEHSLFTDIFPYRLRLASSSTFILITIFYHLIFPYSCLSTFLSFQRRSWLNIISIFSRLCLIITRIYTLIFLIRLHAWWFTLTFFIVHYTFMITLLLDRHGMTVKFILSLLTFTSMEINSVNALISLENISICLHRLYLETFSLPNPTTLHFIIFISILISLQIIGFLLAMFTRLNHFQPEIDKNIITTL